MVLNKKQQTWLFSLITLTFWMPSYFYTPILPAYVRYLGGSLAMVGMVSGAYGLTQALLRIPNGIWADRLGRKKPFIIAGFMAGILSNLLFMTTPAASGLFWARALAGVSATTWVTLTLFMAEQYPPEKLTQTMGILYAVSNVGQLLASTSGGYIAQFWGWKAPFFAALLAGVLGIFFLIFVDKEAPKVTEKLTLRSSVATGFQRWVLTASVLGILIQYGSWVLISFTPIVATNLGASKGELGIVSLFIMGPTIVGSFFIGKFLKVAGQRRLLLFGFGLIALTLILLPGVKSLHQLYFLVTFGGLGRGIILPVLMGMCLQGISANLKGTAMGFFQAIYAVGMFLGPAVSGVLSDFYGLTWAFILAGVLMIIGGLGGWIITTVTKASLKTLNKEGVSK